MTNQEKLFKAIDLLISVQDNWKKDDVVHYGSRFSFDELVAELMTIELRDSSLSSTTT